MGYFRKRWINVIRCCASPDCVILQVYLSYIGARNHPATGATTAEIREVTVLMSGAWKT